MLEFNLYPWRETKEKKQRFIFIFLTGTIFILLSTLFLWKLQHAWFVRKNLRQQIQDLQLLVGKKLTNDNEVNIQNFRLSPFLLNRIMQYWRWQIGLLTMLISKPPSLCWHALQINSNGVSLSGITQSSLLLTTYLQQSSFITYLPSAQLNSLRYLSNQHITQFTVKANSPHSSQ